MSHASMALGDREVREGLCPVCGGSLAAHEKCTACKILVGPMHYERDLRGGLCMYCRTDGKTPAAGYDAVIQARREYNPRRPSWWVER